MTCLELRERADGYARDRLSPGETASFEAHLSGCQACAEWLAGQEPALAPVGQLPRSIEPDTDLWPGISQRISEKKTRPLRRISLPLWVLATAAMLLVAASVGVTGYLLRDRPVPGLVDARTADLEGQYAAAARDLTAELEKAKVRLNPETFAVIERNLRVIDSALAESRRALAGDPGNQVLEELVVAVWRQKMDFLRRATALAPAS